MTSGPGASFRIVSKGPPRRLTDRFRPVSVGAGTVLLVCAAVSVIAVGPLIVTFALQAFTPGTQSAEFLRHVPTSARRNLWVIWPLLIMASPGALLGQKLLGGHRTPILFLRKFEGASAVAAVTRAARRLGQRWLFITLDDGAIAPLRASALGARTAATLGGVIAETAALVVPFLVKALRMLFFVALGGTVALICLSVFRGGLSDATIIGQVFELACVTGIVIVAGFVAVCAGIYIWIIALALFDDLDESGTTRRHSAASVADLLRTRASIVDKQLSFFGARLTVVTVDSTQDPDLWRAAVGGFSLGVAIPLIDVSQPTAHLEWEIMEMQRRFGERCVLIGDQDRLSAFAHSEELARFTDLTAGQEVLAYTLTGRGFRRFTRALRATIEARDRLPLRTDQDDPLVNRG